MPTQRLFAHCPTFPDNVPVAQLPALSLERISSLDAREGKGLFDACQEYGFFLIDLTDTQLGCHLLQAAETMFELNRTTLNLDDTVLSEYAYNPPQNLLGYVPCYMELVKPFLTKQDTSLPAGFEPTMAK